MNRWALLVVVAGIVGGACAAVPRAASGEMAAEGGELTVFAAASLARPLAAVETAYRAETGVRLTIATDSSVALRTQIEQDAPADVFLSADTDNADALVASGRGEAPILPFAATRLVLIVPSDNPAGIATPRDLAQPGVRVVAAGPEVPISRYAEEVVGRLGGMDGFPADFAAGYARNIVSREDNVRSVVTKVTLGEGDAALVYAVDVVGADAITTVEIPPEANVTARYAGVAVTGRPQLAAARAFLAWLAGPRGQAILADHGFDAAG